MARIDEGNRLMWTRVRCAVVFCITLYALGYVGRGITAWSASNCHGHVAWHPASIWTGTVDAACWLTARTAATACNAAGGDYACHKALTQRGLTHCITDNGTGASFSISGECTGARQMLALVASVMCLPGKAGRKWLPALIGAAAIGAMNVARIAITAMSSHGDPGTFGFIHDAAVGVPFSIAVFAVMVACVETHIYRFMRKGQEKQ